MMDYHGTVWILSTVYPFLSTSTCPLTEPTKKNKETVVKWTKACECAIDSEAHTCKSVLTTLGWEKKFILQTEASATGLGYVQSQKNEIGEEHPIAYGSKKLLTREQLYSAIAGKH